MQDPLEVRPRKIGDPKHDAQAKHRFSQKEAKKNGDQTMMQTGTSHASTLTHGARPVNSGLSHRRGYEGTPGDINNSEGLSCRISAPPP